MQRTRCVVNQLRTSSFLHAKVLEYWSPAPLLEEDVGKNAAALADLKEPEAADLEVSSNSSIGDGSDVEVVGVSTPPPVPRRRRHAIRKIPASKAGLRSALLLTLLSAPIYISQAHEIL